MRTRTTTITTAALLLAVFTLCPSGAAQGAGHSEVASIAATRTTSSCPDLTRTGAVVLVQSLNLRAGPSFNDPVRQILPKGMKLTVLQWRGRWAEVAVAGGTSGWVLTQFLGSATLGISAVVQVQALNLRLWPSYASAVKHILARGTRLTIYGSHGRSTWANVTTEDGSSGWVVSCFLGSAASA